MQTLLVFLSWAHHCGRLSRDDMQRYVRAVRDAIHGLTFPAWREVEATLEHWPPWAS